MRCKVFKVEWNDRFVHMGKVKLFGYARADSFRLVLRKLLKK